MFDIGFSELLVIAVVALLVLGPERLPKAARFAGLWMRRARAQWNSVKAEFEHDLATEELKRGLEQTRAAMREAQDALRNTAADVQRDIASARDEMMQGRAPQPDTDHAPSRIAHTLDMPEYSRALPSRPAMPSNDDDPDAAAG